MPEVKCVAELTILERAEYPLRKEEEKVADLIMEYSPEEYDGVLKNADWDTFCQMSVFREGLLNWYPFDKESEILEISSGFGALTGVLSRNCKKITVLEKSLLRAECIAKRYEEYTNITILVGDMHALLPTERYDYIVVESPVNTQYDLEQLLDKANPFLKETGRLLFVSENRFGMKYWCGVPDPIKQQPFAGIRGRSDQRLMTRQDLINALEMNKHVGGWNLYYPFPDCKLPQAIYTDSYLPQASVRDRVIPYYTEDQRKTLVCLENEISDELIANKVFHIFANSFLVECSPKAFQAETIFAALSTDRGNEHGFATVITNHGTVQKKVLHPEGIPALELIQENSRNLETHGVGCVPGTLLKDSIEMSFVSGSSLIEYLKFLYIHEKNKVEDVFDNLYHNILISSEQIPFSQCALRDRDLTEQNAGPILQKAYIDMISYNCFEVDGKLLFYDQEFVRECYPAKYVLFRALRYTYIYIPEADSIIPLQYFKEKYDLTNIWQAFEREESRFVEDNRNYDLLSSFYRWAGVTPETVDDNIGKLYKA